MYAAPYYDHDFERIISADPRLVATIEEKIANAGTDAESAHDEGYAEGAEDDDSPAAERAYDRGKREMYETLRAALDEFMAGRVSPGMAFAFEAFMDEFAAEEDLRAVDAEDAKAIKDAHESQRYAVMAPNSNGFEVYTNHVKADINSHPGLPVYRASLVRGEGFYITDKPTRFRTADSARAEARKRGCWNLSEAAK